MKFNILWNGKIILIIWMQIIDQIFFKYHLNKNNIFIFLLIILYKYTKYTIQFWFFLIIRFKQFMNNNKQINKLYDKNK